MIKPYRSADVDPDLYHRALTGRGEPITSEEVLNLLETLDQWTVDYQRLEEERDELQKELEEAWLVPKDEPHRPCGLCGPGSDRGDGRCECHGRVILKEGET